MDRLVRFATAGSVDDGKSTLLGRLLVETGSLFEDQLSEIDAASLRQGRGERDLAFATDGLREERERNITIDVAYRHLRTGRRRFLLADSPGHAEFTRNMVTAASTADFLVVLVDAARRATAQTRRHLAIAAFLRIPVVVAVNKMDLVAYDRGVFDGIVHELQALAVRLGNTELHAVPISAYYGDNVVSKASTMPWYEGPTLMEKLETIPITDRGAGRGRLVVQNVLRHDDLEVVTGILSGAGIRVGDRLGGSVVDRIWVAGDESEVAGPGTPVALRLVGGGSLKRGDWLRIGDGEVPRSNRLEASLFWMHSEPLRCEMTYLLRQGPRVIHAKVRQVEAVVELQTGDRFPAVSVAQNDLAKVVIELDQDVDLALYGEDREGGSFVLTDASGQIVATGTVDRVLLPARARPSAQVLWLTGLSGAGKSTLAEETLRRLRADGIDAIHLDGDSLRSGLCSDLGFSAEDRMENVRRAAEVAKLMAAQGRPVICSLISPLRAHRERARSILGEAFVEVFVHCPIEECIRRDPKGLYARALSGAIPGFTGIGAPYEEPVAADLVLETDRLDPEACVERLVATLRDGAFA